MILRVISYRHLCSLLQSISVVCSEYVKEGGRSHRVHFVGRADFSDEDFESSDWYVGVHLPNCNIGEECEANWHGRSWKKEVVAFIVVYTWCFNATDVCLCCSAHTSGCVVDGLGATAAF